MDEPISNKEARVSISEDALVVINLVEADTAVVRYVASAEDPVAATRHCLQVGARSVRAASASIDTGTVRTEFDRLTSDFGTCVTGAIDNISEVTSSLLDGETGGLKVVLDTHLQALDDVLDARFDPDSKKSVMNKIEAICAEALVQQKQEIKRIVSLDTEDSPLRVMKLDILAGFTDPLAELGKRVSELSEKIAISKAVASVTEITTAKGFTFEAVVHERLCAFAAAHGDLAEKTGGQVGSAGTKKGDELVTLNADDTNGVGRRIVIEAKARKLGIRQTHQELDEALENRDAVVAIAVFDGQAQAPTSVPFSYSDNKAIVVFDGEGDASALQLAYMWARWVARRSDTGISDAADAERVNEFFKSAQRTITRHKTIKQAHTQARKAIDQAGKEAEAMVKEVEQALEDLQGELALRENEES